MKAALNLGDAKIMMEKMQNLCSRTPRNGWFRHCKRTETPGL